MVRTKEDDKIVEKQAELVQLIERYAKCDGTHSTAIPSLYFSRISYKEGPVHAVQGPALCIIAQGEKTFMLAENNYYYDPFHYLVVSVDLPLSGQIIQATPQTPLLCLSLNFEPELIFDIIQNSGLSINVKKNSHRGMFVGETNLPLLEATFRLVGLLDVPQDIPALAPLVIREIFYRILQAEQGDFLKQIAINGSHAQRIIEAIRLIKQDFTKPLRIEKLASATNMSISSLHRHFKQVTAMSPLQYQKQLRLQEARRLLQSEKTDAADAGFQVGYESPSQFSREYSRLFGLPPISDMKRLRNVSNKSSI